MNLGMPEMIFILVLALVVVGPRKLPELARQLGKFVAEFRRANNEFKNQLEAEMLKVELEERARKQQGSPEVFPAEDSWERLMRPLAATVSRPTRGLVGAGGEPEATASSSAFSPREQTSPTARGAD